MSNEPLGTGNGHADDPIKWITPAEAAKFEKLLGRNYVRIDPKLKKPADSAKDFFYKIIHINPYTPAGRIGGTMDFLLQFHLQKYHRNKKRKVAVKESMNDAEREEEQNMPVAGHERNAVNDFVLVDPDANITIDARRFEQDFVPDNV